MEHGRIAMLVAVGFFLLTGAYWSYSGQLLFTGIAALNALVAAVVFHRLRDAPRAV